MINKPTDGSDLLDQLENSSRQIRDDLKNELLPLKTRLDSIDQSQKYIDDLIKKIRNSSFYNRKAALDNIIRKLSSWGQSIPNRIEDLNIMEQTELLELMK